MTRRWLLPAAIVLIAMASLGATQLGAIAADLVNAATVTIVAVVLVRGPRRHDQLRRTRLLLLAALGTAFLAGLMPVGYEMLRGHTPTMPWIGDAVALSYVPFTIAGMLYIPTTEQRVGYRARALADGLLASSSLWYLLLAVGAHARVHHPDGVLGTAVAFAYPAGDVFVLSCALTVLARCAPAAGRMVAWMVAGFAVVAGNDVWQFLTGQAGTASGPALAFQCGLLLLLAAAAVPAVQFGDAPRRWPVWLLGAGPFVPLIACMVLTGHMVLHHEDMPSARVFPALIVAIALTLRQLAGSRDKQRIVDQLQARESKLEAALRVDELTGLANRLGVTERLQSALEDPTAWPVTVALLDLNDFKLINDNHGHAVGDEVLRVLAGRVAAVVRTGDTVARLGGDEFAVITTGLDQSRRDTVAERLLRAFDAPVQVCGQRFLVHASIGIVIGQPPDTASQLLAHADAAMYRAKEDKQSTSRATVLDARGRAQVTQQLRIREEIAKPDLREFDVNYQPVVDLATGRIRGFEALLRWNHPFLGPIAPDAFIPLAEQAGTIGLLGQFVLERAVADLATVVGQSADRQLGMSVNVSPRQLVTEGFVDLALDTLRRHGLSTQQLALEITEQAFETNLGPLAAAVAALADAGVVVAVDDFGTGYSSLRYLQHLQLGIMKIDRTFVADVATSGSARQLVSSVATMAAGLGLRVIAEGIETLDQLRLLQEINCELGQGYLFGPAVPAAEMQRLVESDHTYPVGAGDAAPLLPTQRARTELPTA